MIHFVYQTRITDTELTAIAIKMKPENVETFASKRLGITLTEIANVKYPRNKDPEAVKRDILELWKNKYEGSNARVVGIICDSFVIQNQLSTWLWPMLVE